MMLYVVALLLAVRDERTRRTPVKKPKETEEGCRRFQGDKMDASANGSVVSLLDSQENIPLGNVPMDFNEFSALVSSNHRFHFCIFVVFMLALLPPPYHLYLLLLSLHCPMTLLTRPVGPSFLQRVLIYNLSTVIGSETSKRVLLFLPLVSRLPDACSGEKDSQGGVTCTSRTK